MSKTIIKTFRCSEEESALLLEAAEKNYKSISDYIRMCLFDSEANQNQKLPAELTKILCDLRWEVNKIGTNINQVVRACNSKKYVTKEDVANLIRYLNLVNYQLESICEKIENTEEEEEA